MSLTPQDELISIAEAAQMAGVDHKTIRRMIAAGELPARRIRERIIRIRRADVTNVGEAIRPAHMR